MHGYFFDKFCYLLYFLHKKLEILSYVKYKYNIILETTQFCDVEETTHYSWPTVSGRDIFISSH